MAVFAAAVLVGAALLLNESIHQAEQQLYAREKLHQEKMVDVLSDDLFVLTSDVLLLAGLPETRRWAETGLVTPHLGEEFLSLARFRGLYSQLRLIDANGWERLRVDQADDQPVLVQPDQLRHKGGREFVRAAKELSPGTVHLSNLDLNQEHGRVEDPISPMLRFTSPLHDSSGVFKGQITLNLPADTLIHTLVTGLDSPARHVLLVNSDGYFLHGMSPEEEWGFLILDRADQRMDRRFPDAWAAIRSDGAGVVRTPQGLFLSQPVDLTRVADALRGVGGRRIDGNRFNVVSEEDRWLLVSYLPPDQLAALRWEVLRAGLPLLGASVLVSILLAAVIARILLYRYTVRRALQYSEKRLQNILASASDAIISIDETQTIQVFSGGAERIFGYQQQEVIGKPVTMLMPEHVAPRHGEFLQSFLSQDRSFQQLTAGRRLDLPRRDGSVFPAELNVTRIQMDGQVLLSAFIRDVSSQQQAEQALRRSEQRYRTIFNSVLDAMVLNQITKDGRAGVIEDFNESTSQLTGFSREQLQKMTVLDLFPPEERTVVEAELFPRLLREGRLCFESTVQRQDGSSLAVEVNSILVELDGRRMVVSSARDITERNRAAEELRRSERFLDAVVENIPNMIFVKEAERLSFVRLNQAAEELLGIPRSDMLGKGDSDFFPDDLARNFINADRAVLSHGALVDIDEEYVSTARGETRLLHTKKIPIYDRDGRPEYLLGISEDITERRRIEDDRTRALLAAENANRAKSEFLATMSHELRTPMNAVLGFSELLGSGIAGELNDKQHRFIQNIHDSGQHLLQLINDILDLSKVEAGRMVFDPGELRLPKLIGDVVNVVQPLVARKAVVLTTDIDDDFPVLMQDETKLKQILYNLLSNAIKFTPGGGRVVLHASCVPAAGTASRRVRIEVRDNGIGIDPTDQERIFNRFEQVDSSHARPEPGTGLGLPLCRKLTELIGGSLGVVSDGVGRGSTFWIEFPFVGTHDSCAVELPSPTGTGMGEG